jgi:hypothetical protein
MRIPVRRGKTAKVNKPEAEVIAILAKCEQILVLLHRNIRESGVRKNEIIEHNREVAHQSVIHCLEKIAAGESDKARVLCEIALLRAGFASKAFDAERTESLLGEADFLELSPQWRKQAEESLRNMEHAIDEMQNALNGQR